MDRTDRLDLPYILPSQAQKHVTYNEAIRRLDALTQIGCMDRNRTTPPASPLAGDSHLIGTPASSDWTGKEGQIATFQDGAWAYFVPHSGWLAYIASEYLLLAHDGTAWRVAAPESLAMLGINTSADGTNRLSVSSDASLFSHAGHGHQLKLNKANPGETASLLLQTGWSGRAEIGLAGDDAFRVKVSADGSSWHSGLIIDGATGRTTFEEGLRLFPRTGDPAAPDVGEIWYENSIAGFRAKTAAGAIDLGLRSLSLHDFWTETHFTVLAAGNIGNFFGEVISSGTATATPPAASFKGYNPFGLFFISSATANSGYRMMTVQKNTDYFGNIAKKFQARLLNRTSFASRKIFVGYHDTTSVADPVDGAYFVFNSGVISAVTAANNVRTTHASTYAAVLNEVYTLDIGVNAAGTSARFRVYEATNANPVLDVTNTANIPIASTNNFGAGIVAVHAGTAISDICILYSMGFGTLNGFNRTRG